MLKITLRRSSCKGTKRQQATVRGLGLRKLHDSKILADTPAIRGMVGKVSHLVECEKISESMLEDPHRPVEKN